MIGSRLGVYTITAKIGAGGMGEVYRATDTRLMRDVAIKILPAAFLDDRERLARFEREAQLLAQLHHPNISSVFGLEESDGVRALVMELVEGPTLMERLAAGPIPLEESLSIARQIAEALEEAHEKGIIHRDLKPANVKLTLDGRVKVLDFGLAKALDPVSPRSSSAGSQLSQSPTLVNSATIMGTILGTAAYMAPEQAAGGAADRRADIWSFGVVLYEMLTGRRLFEGETVSHVLAGVLKDAPDFSALPAGTPERIADLLRHCLRKKPRERLQAIGDARIVIEEVLADPHREAQRAAGSPAAGIPVRASKAPWIAAAAGVAAAVLFAGLWIAARRTEPPSRTLHASLVAPQGAAFGDTFALSPDGRHLVFEAYDQKNGTRALWMRSLDRAEAVRLPASEGGEMPFWSPDGAHIGFFAEGKLRRLDPQGGPAQALCDAMTPRGGAWGPDGRIVFAGSFRAGLSVISASGGAPRELTTLDAARHEKSHRFPVFLPDGNTILFLAQTGEGGSANDQSAIELLDLTSGKRDRLLAANSSPLFAPPDRILFWRDGVMLAAKLDTARQTIMGESIPVASPVAYTGNEQALASVSHEGTLVYLQGARGTSSSLVWIDRKGLASEVIRDRELYGGYALSHDGKRLAYSMNSTGQGSTDLWIHDIDRGSTSRLTFEDGNEVNPVWSADDRFLYYSSDRENDGTIFRRSVDGSSAPDKIGTTEAGIWPLAASSDGRWLVVGGSGGETNRDLLRFDLATKQLTALVATAYSDQGSALSPDNRLLAYSSDQSGRFEVYVQALGADGGRWQVSTDGGVTPHWRADGRELFFFSLPDRMMSVEVEAGGVPRFSSPRELFRHPIDDYDVTPEGDRFVCLRPADSGLEKPLTLISNWTRLIEK